MKTPFELLIAFVKGTLSVEEKIYVETILLNEKENIKILERLNYLQKNNSLDKYISELNKIEENDEESDILLSEMISVQDLIKYIKNELSSEENQIIEQHLEENIYSKELYIDFLLLLQNGKLDTYITQQKIKSDMLFDQIVIDNSVLINEKQEEKSQTPSRKLWRYGLSIAATLIGMLLISNFFFDFPFSFNSRINGPVAYKSKNKNNVPATLGDRNESSVMGKTELVALAEENIKDIEEKINTLFLEENSKHTKWNIEAITRFLNYKKCTITIFLNNSCSNFYYKNRCRFSFLLN